MSWHHNLPFPHLVILFLLLLSLFLSPISSVDCNGRGTLTGSPAKCWCDPGYKPFTQSDCSKTCAGGGGTCCAGYYCPGDGKQYSCPAGTYATVGSSSCSNCTAGHWCSMNSDSATQNQCEPGTWAGEGTPNGCAFCDPGYYCTAGSGSPQQNPCSPGTYSIGGASSCSSCDAGYYCVGASTTSAQYPCPAGTYSTSGSSSCTNCTTGFYCLDASPSATQFACPPGSYSREGAEQCEPCAAGYYCPSSSTSTPTDQICPAGFYSSDGAVFCEACDTGYACPNPGSTSPTEQICLAGTYSQGGASTCSPCDAGYYCEDGSDSPVQFECPAGTYSSSSATTCLNCTAGYYCSSASPSATQNACPDGYYSQDGAAQCTKCAAGHYCIAPSTSSTQHECPPGSWSFEGSAACSNCFAGFYCPQGATSPTEHKCPSGTYTFAGASNCTNCTAGHYCREGSSSPTASPCAPGYWSEDGAGQCSPCPAGFECSGTANTQPEGNACPSGKYCGEACSACVDCPEGYICPNNATKDSQINDNPCPDGYYSSSGSSSCSPCAAGFYCTGVSTTPYQNICPPGTWSSEGSTLCGPCQAGFKCDSGSTQPNATACLPGTWSSAGKSSCSLCPAGYECPNTETSSPNASPCSAGTFCAQGCTQCQDCTPGFHCKYTSQSSSEYICPEGYFCPAGSAYPGTSNPCPSGYTSGVGSSTLSQCNLALCFGIIQTDTAIVCSGQGVCTDADTCLCSGGYTGSHCNESVCYLQSGINACNYPNGTCTSPNVCTCVDGWTGIKCDRFTCGGVPFNDPLVCNQHGLCTAVDTCKCDTGYAGTSCDDFLCYGIASSDPNVCSSHGTCYSINNCSCATGYTGSQCSDFTCFDIDSSQPSVCSSRGSCDAYNDCSCDSPYFGDECNQFSCFGYAPNTTNVCSGHGNCNSPNSCSCTTNYIGHDCSMYLCFGINATASFVCSGKGTCVDVDTCECVADRHGEKCELLYDNPPTTILKAPRHIGPCDSLLLDGSFSYNQFVEGPLRYHWSIISAASNFTQLQDLLRSKLDWSAVLIPPSYLSTYGTYKFSLYVNDTRGIPGLIKEVLVTKMSQTAPQLVIEGFNEYIITRSQQLDIRGLLQVLDCQGNSGTISDASVAYTWSQTGGTSVSFRSNRNMASFAALAFPAGTNSFTFQLTSTIVSSGVSTSAAVVIHVVSDELHPLISGGDRTIPASTPLTLDASESYDPDQDASPSHYFWSCVTCTNQFVFFSQQNLPQVVFPANTYIPDETHIFRLNFTKGNRWKTTEITVAFSMSDSPQVTVFGGGLVNRNERLVLKAAIDLTYFSGEKDDLQSYWTSNDLDMSSSVLVARTDQKTRFELALKENILELGKTYVLSYRVVTKDSIVSASTSVTVNRPPQNGGFEISPLAGAQYDTEFQLAAPAWIDSELPLVYMFEYSLSVQPNKWFIIQPFSARSTATFLPVNAGTITVRMTVRDNRGAQTTLEQNIVVSAAALSASSTDLLDTVSRVTQANRSLVQTDELTVHRIQSGFLLLNHEMGAVGSGFSCSTDCESRITNLQSSSLGKLQSVSAKLIHTESPNDKQLETIVDTLNEITNNSDTLSSIHIAQSWDILNSSICSFPSMKFTNGGVYTQVMTILDRLWASQAHLEQIRSFDQPKRIIKCVSESLFRQKVNGESVTSINTPNFGVQVFKDLLPYMQKVGSVSLFGSAQNELQLSSRLGQQLDDSISVALSIARYTQTPVNGSDTPVSDVLDISFYNAQSGSLVEISNLPLDDANQFSFAVDSLVFDNLESDQLLECRYWNSVSQQWTTEGVESVDVDFSSQQVMCRATHASLFSVVVTSSVTQTPSPIISAREILLYLFAAGVGVNIFTCVGVCCLLACCGACCVACVWTCRRKKYDSLETEATGATITRAESVDSSLDSHADAPNKELEEWKQKVKEADQSLKASMSRLNAVNVTIDKLGVTNEHLLNQLQVADEQLNAFQSTVTQGGLIILKKQELRISNRRLLLKTFEAIQVEETASTLSQASNDALKEKSASVKCLRQEIQALKVALAEFSDDLDDDSADSVTSEGILRLQQMMEQERFGAQAATKRLEKERNRLRQKCKELGVKM